MQDEGSDAQQVKANGWRQGSILDDALVRELTDAGKLPRHSVMAHVISAKSLLRRTSTMIELLANVDPTTITILGGVCQLPLVCYGSTSLQTLNDSKVFFLIVKMIGKGYGVSLQSNAAKTLAN
jgi:hypothetical protein